MASHNFHVNLLLVLCLFLLLLPLSGDIVQAREKVKWSSTKLKHKSHLLHRYSRGGTKMASNADFSLSVCFPVEVQKIHKNVQGPWNLVTISTLSWSWKRMVMLIHVCKPPCK